MVERSALSLRNLRRRFGTYEAVAGVDLDIADGEFVTFLGPSGCGKTTLLNLIAGFMPPTDGTILIKGRSVEGQPSFRRDIGFVFQDYALFPHMTVTQNVAFGLKMRNAARAEIDRRVQDALALMQLPHLGDRKPHQLSGGQRQRVALARALVIDPTILLLDEPLSNLDLKLREGMRREITQLQRKLGATTIFVTHDQGEALTMSDRIVVLNAGRIEQIGSPGDIYERPASRFVAEFIGSANIFRGRANSAVGTDGRVEIELDQGVRLRAVAGDGISAGSLVDLVIRPERFALSKADTAPEGLMAFPAQVRDVLYLGSKREVYVTLPGETAAMVEQVNDADAMPLSHGLDISILARPDDCYAIKAI